MWWQVVLAWLLCHSAVGADAKRVVAKKDVDRSLATDDYYDDPDQPLYRPPSPSNPDFPQPNGPNLPIQLEPEEGNACHQQCGEKFSATLKAAFKAPNHYERFEQVCHHFNETLHCMAQLNLCSNQESFDVMTSGLYYMCVEQKKAFEAVIECVDAQADAIQQECDATCHTKAKMANWAVQSGMVDRFLGKTLFSDGGKVNIPPPPPIPRPPAFPHPNEVAQRHARRMGGIYPNDDFTPLALRLPPDINSEETRREAAANGNKDRAVELEKVQPPAPPQPNEDEGGFSKTSSKRWKNKKPAVKSVANPEPAASPPLDEGAPAAAAEPAPKGRDDIHVGDVVEERFGADAPGPLFQPPADGPSLGGQNPQFMRTLLQDGCELTRCHLGCMRAKFDTRCGGKAGTLLSEAFVRPIGETQKLLGVGGMSSVLHAFVPQQCDFMMNEEALQKFRIDPKEDEELRAMHNGETAAGFNATASSNDTSANSTEPALAQLENSTAPGVLSENSTAPDVLSENSTAPSQAEGNSTAEVAVNNGTEQPDPTLFTPVPPVIDGKVVGDPHRAQPPIAADDFYYRQFHPDQGGR